MDIYGLELHHFIGLGIGCLVMGYLIFLVLLLMLPNRLKSENYQQRNLVLQKAQRQRSKILEDNRKRNEHRIALNTEQLASDLADHKLDLENQEKELTSLSDTLGQADSRIKKQEKDIETKRGKIASTKQKYLETHEQLTQAQGKLTKELEKVAGEKASDIKKRLSTNLIEERKIDSQKATKDFQDGLDSHISRLASRAHSSIAARYSPEFVWPKTTSVVEVANPLTFDFLSSSEHSIMEELRELTEDVQIDFTLDKNENPIGIKVIGGYGIYKEAAKKTLEELVNKDPSNWRKATQVYKTHKSALEAEAFKLGKSAVVQLKLKGVHDEILRMVGALNWRTSYRQNQFLHSLEVAKLAGIIAHELKVDPDVAKRCGLLHDIGKGIDYRIEGSHAVISGDYADRFGESRLVCDTVMSHHNDLVLETPMSYVLKSADTLSGARPGARVNLEEGYQIRLSAIDQAVKSFPGIAKVAIMSGGREVHVDVNHKTVKEKELKALAEAIARKIEEEVAYPGQIKVLLTRRFESSAVA